MLNLKVFVRGQETVQCEELSPSPDPVSPPADLLPAPEHLADPPPPAAPASLQEEAECCQTDLATEQWPGLR